MPLRIYLFILLILTSNLIFATDINTKNEAVKQPQKQTQQEQPNSPQIPANYYQNLGLPPINKPWTPNDYLQAVTVLTPVAQQTPQYLPHYSDKTAEPYMQHMVNGQNIYQVLQFTTAQQQRIDLIIVYLDGIQRLLALYQQSIGKATPYYAEWVDIIAMSSYLAALSAPELQASLASVDPSNTAKKEAVTILQTAMVNPVITGLQAMPRLPPVLAWRLIQQLNYTMPSYARTLPLGSQQQIYDALLTALQQAQNQQLREGIQKLAMLFNTAN
ncbi:MAG: hypothetical protein ACHP9Y_01720 [Gammaproteobacteria bacterium]